MVIEINIKSDFKDYKHAFLEENAKHNLISKNDEKFLWEKHVFDSLSLNLFFEKYGYPESILDIGTGGGFPSVPIAVAFPQINVYALDSIAKKLNAVTAKKQAWEKEQERRKKINEKSGLKTLGAGLRYLRGGKMLTLQDVAQGSGLTLSVYHRIEMGQREVTEEQFNKIAHALGFDPEELQVKIYELDMAGTLQEFKKSGKTGIFHPKGGYNDLPLRDISFQNTALDIYDIGNVKAPASVGSVNMPLTGQCFAIKANGKTLNLPTENITLLVSKTTEPSEGQLAVLKTDTIFEVGTIENKNGLTLKTCSKTYNLKDLSAARKIMAILT